MYYARIGGYEEDSNDLATGAEASSGLEAKVGVFWIVPYRPVWCLVICVLNRSYSTDYRS